MKSAWSELNPSKKSLMHDGRVYTYLMVNKSENRKLDAQRRSAGIDKTVLGVSLLEVVYPGCEIGIGIGFLVSV
jgi:hypothetical protein